MINEMKCPICGGELKKMMEKSDVKGFEVHFRNLDNETCFILTKTNKGALNPKERI